MSPRVSPLVSIEDLRVCFDTSYGVITAVDGVSLVVNPGECLGVVGESGSGKSVTFSALLQLIKRPGYIASGRLRFDGLDLRGLPERSMRRLLGKELVMTMQDALTSLNPALTVEEQITEVLFAHDDAVTRHSRRGRRAARLRALEMLKNVGIPAAEQRLSQYPHELSGGMRQRVMIAIALACRPRLLIADEPTTALDTTIQAQVLELIDSLRRDMNMSVVLITHDLGVVAEYTDRLIVMYAGQIVESGPTAEVLHDPQHPYTRGLLRSSPSLERIGMPIEPIEGEPPVLTGMDPCCRFYERCKWRMDACRQVIPMIPVGPQRFSRCILKTDAHLG